MQLTNKFNLPQSIVNAVANDPYDNKGTLSVTTLLKSPYQRALEVKHKEDIVEDVADRIYSLLGQSVHHILERAGSDEDLVEARFFAEVRGEKISGQLDLLEADGTLCDFKVTSVWAILAAMKEGKMEWERQLNMLAWLAHAAGAKEYGYEVKRLRIVAIARDWSPSKAKQGGTSYPQRVEAIEFPLWDEDRQLRYIESRIVAHLDPSPKPCSDEDRWAKPDTFAVMKKGGKRAMRVLPSFMGAYEWCQEHGHVDKQELTANLKDGIRIEERKGENVRCEGYCSVSQFCPHFATLKPAAPAASLRKL